MPWRVEKSSQCPTSRPWAVIKETDGSIEGCHSSEQKAQRQQAALYASEGRSEPIGGEMSELYDEFEDAAEMQVYRQADPGLLVFRDDEGDPLVEGRIVPYEEWSEVDSLIEGRFMERFARGSFAKTIMERADRVRVYFEHGRSRIFGTQPIAELREAWEQPDGLYFRASLLQGLPELFRDGLRRGLYGASVGAKVLKVDRLRRPQRSDYNPEGLEERVYREMRASDFSITPRPHYASALALRSITDDLALERLLQDPKRLLEAIARQTEPDDPEPPHSEREEPLEAPVESRRTQPVHDYLRPEEDDESWRL